MKRTTQNLEEVIIIHSKKGPTTQNQEREEKTPEVLIIHSEKGTTTQNQEREEKTPEVIIIHSKKGTTTQNLESEGKNTKKNQPIKTKQLTLTQFSSPLPRPSNPVVPKTEPSPCETTNLLDGGAIHFWPHFLSQDQARDFFHVINNSMNWVQSDIKVRGKVYKSPRLQSWMADKDIMKKARLYLNTEPVPWSPEVQKIRNDIEALCNFQFDYVLMNLYRNGNDHISPHSDREAIEASKSTIASLSLGATRRFVVQHSKRKDVKKIEYSLTPGSLIVMTGPMQKFWKHSVPKQAKVKDPRINFTFRKS